MAYVSGNRSTTISIGTRLSEVFTGLSEAYAAWRIYRRTINELQSLSVRELDDLGLNRSMLKAAALEAAYGKAQ